MINEARARQRWYVDRLVDDFVAAGYQIDGELSDGTFVLVGYEDILGDSLQLEVRVQPGYPFVAPKVKAVDGSGGYSWHQDPEGWLCLWEDTQSDPGAWGSRAVIVERAQAWFREAANQWRNDAPDLDLDRYWPRMAGLALHGELPPNGWVRLTHSRASGRESVWEIKGNGSGRKRNAAAGFVIDIGDPLRPARTLFELVDLADHDVGMRLQNAIDNKQVGWIVVRYKRSGHPGVLVLKVAYGSEPELVAVHSASTTSSARHLRAGHEAKSLGESRVAVVGLGAIGSFAADGLARAGVRMMTLMDGDYLAPGNLFRHVLREESVGWNKAEAMRRHLISTMGLNPTNLVACPHLVLGLEDAVRVLAENDGGLGRDRKCLGGRSARDGR